MTRLCCECRWFWPASPFAGCRRPERAGPPDPVYGASAYYPSCASERARRWWPALFTSEADRCGPEGLFWEPAQLTADVEIKP